MPIMKPDELQAFCVSNAGAVATGEDKDGNRRRGRILAYTPSKSDGWIILEDTTLAKKKMDDIASGKTILVDKWVRVIGGEYHLGYACVASTIKLADVSPKALPKATVNVAPSVPRSIGASRKCKHDECYVDWCWKAYIGEA
jgi:hypothetical protein